MSTKNVLNVKNDSELLSYIINVTPELRGEIDLPVQGQSIAPIGKLILSNDRYRNAFIRTVNLIGVTVVKRNAWENPWYFTTRGELNFGQQVRELVIDLCNVYDYNSEFENKTKFLESEVPNVFNYIHEVNFQKFYSTTTSNTQLSMAFDTEGSLYDFITESVSQLYESMKYDTYIVDKYMLCRRIVDGTIPVSYIENYTTLSNREKVSKIKNVSNLFTFRKPNFNPAGIRKATSFDNQIVIVNTDFEADFSTDVMATSFFRNEAEMRAQMVLIDGFASHDVSRLKELLGDKYIEFTETELQSLENVPAVLISNEFFMDYDYSFDSQGTSRETEFFNPTTLENNHYLHVWRVFSTSPFENCTVFVYTDKPTIESVSITPSECTVSKGQSIQLTAVVDTVNFANKGVIWEITDGDGATINSSGLVKIPTDFVGDSVTVTATSIYDKEKTATATITVI